MVRYVSKIRIDDSFGINWNVSRINKYHFDFHTAFTMKSIEKRTSWLFRFVPRRFVVSSSACGVRLRGAPEPSSDSQTVKVLMEVQVPYGTNDHHIAEAIFKSFAK